MRVLSVGRYYPPHTHGGYELVQHGTDLALRESGHDVRVLAGDFLRAGVAAGDEPRIFRELSARPGARERNEMALARQLDEHRPDVIAWWEMGGISAGLFELARERGVPGVLFVHDYWPAAEPGPALADAGPWLFNSSATAQGTLLTSERRPRDWTVLTPGISPAFLRAPAEPQPPAWGWRLAYVGRVAEQKGVHTAVQALGHLPSEATLRIVGDGEPAYIDRLRELAREAGAAARVSFAPFAAGAELIGEYRAADAVVFPTIWQEPWGLVPLEAMALGRPVLASGRGGSSEYLVGGGNCLIFAAGDPRSLAERCLELAADPDLRARICAWGRRTAAEHPAEAFERAARAALEQAGGAGRAIDPVPAPPRESPA